MDMKCFAIKGKAAWVVIRQRGGIDINLYFNGLVRLRLPIVC
jgi:hypothetical protein